MPLEINQPALNAEAVARADDDLQFHASAAGTDKSVSTVHDVLTDLMHWCDANGANFKAQLAEAVKHHAEETGQTLDMWDKTVRRLRDEGYCVVMWTPEELGEADTGQLEDIVISRGNEYLEEANRLDFDNLDAFTQHYIIAALWSSTDESGEPLDKNYNPVDIAEEALKQIVEDCNAFQEQNQVRLLEAYQLYPPHHDAPLPQCAGGHDFWLTRNRHGAGFWDRGFPEDLGKALTDAAHAFGECDLYVGDDGEIHIS